MKLEAFLLYKTGRTIMIYIYLLLSCFLGNLTGQIFCERGKLETNDSKMEEIFTEVYEKNTWWSSESRSGTGSTLANTVFLREELVQLLSTFQVSSMLDIPCGDFNWMKAVDLKSLKYIGADLVKQIVIENNIRFQTDTIKFMHLNACKDTLPRVDLIFCRDMLQHMSLKDIKLALANFKKSGSKYLLTSTFPHVDLWYDLETGFDCREINFRNSPFNFPAPLYLIVENSIDVRGKCMGLWLLKDIPDEALS